MESTPFHRVVGLDLTDPHARSPRPVDVAVLDVPTSTVTFQALAWNQRRLALPASWSDGGTLLVLDGPQAWAEPPRLTRECERKLGAPAHTPHLPPALGRPFAGYIQGSVALFDDLVHAGWVLPGLGSRVTLLEGYPGAAWPVLAGRKLPAKGCEAGLAARRALLAQAGLLGLPPKLTHDELDAALLTLLGLRFAAPGASPGERAVLVGKPVARDARGVLREGQIVMPAGAGATRAPVAQGPSPARGSEAKSRAEGWSTGRTPPPVEWVYFATTSGASKEETLRLVLEQELLVRTAHKANKTLIPNVGNVQPGDRLLLVYGGEPIALLTVESPSRVVARTQALARLDGFADEIRAAGYTDDFIDSVEGAFTGFVVNVLDGDLALVPTASKKGNNALFRASDVTWTARR
jgi:hypothetical protein